MVNKRSVIVQHNKTHLKQFNLMDLRFNGIHKQNYIGKLYWKLKIKHVFIFKSNWKSFYLTDWLMKASAG